MIKLKMYDVKKIFKKNYILKKYNFIYNNYIISKFFIINKNIFNNKKINLLNIENKKDVDYINSEAYIKDVKDNIKTYTEKASNFYNQYKNHDFRRAFYKKYKSGCKIEIGNYTQMLIDNLDLIYIKLGYNNYAYEYIKPFYEYIKNNDVVALEDVENKLLYIYNKDGILLALLPASRVENYLFD